MTGMKTTYETLVSSGYAFLKNVSDHEEIFENKFTGLRVLFDNTLNYYSIIFV